MNINYKPFEIKYLKPWKVILFSASLTLLIYILIPMLDYSKIDPNSLKLKKVKTIKIPNIPPKKKKKEKIKNFIKEKKIEDQSIKKTFKPLPIDVSLDLDMDEGLADFSLDFDMEQEVNFSDLVFEVSEVDQKPVPLVQVSPLYPISARTRGIEGVVNLLFVVDKKGLVSQVEVLSSENGEYFDKSAVNAVKKWKFKPAIKNGEKVSVKVTIPLVFGLNQ